MNTHQIQYKLFTKLNSLFKTILEIQTEKILFYREHYNNNILIIEF